MVDVLDAYRRPADSSGVACDTRSAVQPCACRNSHGACVRNVDVRLACRPLLSVPGGRRARCWSGFMACGDRPPAMATTSPATAATRRASPSSPTVRIRCCSTSAPGCATSASSAASRSAARAWSATSTGTTSRACRSSAAAAPRHPPHRLRAVRARRAPGRRGAGGDDLPAAVPDRPRRLPRAHRGARAGAALPDRRVRRRDRRRARTSARRSATASRTAATSVAYISDHQQPTSGARIADGVVRAVPGVDLLIHDAQYTPAEFARKSTWGHCTVEYAVWLAGEVGARRLALYHHDPTHDDDMIDRLDRRRRGLRRGDGGGGVRRPRGPHRRARRELTPWTPSPGSPPSCSGAVFVVAAVVQDGRRHGVGGPGPRARRADAGGDGAARRRAGPRRAARRRHRRRRCPAIAAAVLLVAFSVAIARQLVDGRHPPCACFGAWSQTPARRGPPRAQRRPDRPRARSPC